MTNAIQLNETIRQGMDVITQRAFREQGRFVKASGLSMQQFSILMQLHYQKQCGISEISERMDITSAAVSQMVDKLVHSQLLERSEDPHDRRAKQLQLSEAGRKLIEGSLAARHAWVGQLEQYLSPEELETVRQAMSILAATLPKLPLHDKVVSLVEEK